MILMLMMFQIIQSDITDVTPNVQFLRIDTSEANSCMEECEHYLVNII